MTDSRSLRMKTTSTVNPSLAEIREIAWGAFLIGCGQDVLPGRSQPEILANARLIFDREWEGIVDRVTPSATGESE